MAQRKSSALESVRVAGIDDMRGMKKLACHCLDAEGKPQATCKDCGGEGFIATEGRPWLQLVAEFTNRLEQATPEERESMRLKLEPIYREDVLPRPKVPLQFQNVRFKHYRARTESQRKALELVHSWIDRIVAGKAPMIALVGPTGVGKSMLLYCAAWHLFEVHKISMFTAPWYSFGDELRYGRIAEGAADIPPHHVRAELYRQRIVGFDEIRFTADTPFDSTELAKHGCHAKDNGVAVFVNSNANPLSLVMGPEAADRFEILEMSGTSMR